ncbi:MAG TPA: hypothetical protein VEL05_11045 [Candidatus Acidoferrum sp.]|nr:hypothetical protein [Candidatus Acidoferrum sp.]
MKRDLTYRRRIGPGRLTADGVGGLPDARDGLTRLERAILFELSRLEGERGGGAVPTAMLYGRVVEHVNVSVEEFQAVLARLVGR